MTELTATKCSMCEIRDMVPVMGTQGLFTTFMMCPNCDAPKGKMVQNSYDGVGPTRGRGSPI